MKEKNPGFGVWPYPVRAVDQVSSPNIRKISKIIENCEKNNDIDDFEIITYVLRDIYNIQCTIKDEQNCKELVIANF